jgi:hypothetical protein
LPINGLSGATPRVPGYPATPSDLIAHEVAVALLDYVAEVNADAILDKLFRRQASVAPG